jgi:hypothetical protein
MPIRLLAVLQTLALMAFPAHSASPDAPAAPVPSARYRSVISDTKSYRPVEPLPWGDVNRRVAPKDGSTQEGQGSRGKAQTPEAAPRHKH